MNYRTGDYAKYARFISETETQHNIPAGLLALTLWQASAYDPDKIACKGQHPTIGVRGIASLTPEDCKTLWNGDDRRDDPQACIVGAARLLKMQRDRFTTWKLALLAYHSSADTVRKAMHGEAHIPIDADKYAAQARECCGV